MATTTRYKKDKPETGTSQLRETVGEVLPNGDIVDLIREPSGVALIRYRTGQPLEIAPKIKSDGIWYCPPDLNPAILGAMPFPQGVSEYGTDEQLFDDIRNVFRDISELPLDGANTLACCSRGSWLGELMPCFPTFCITADTMSQAFRVFQLLSKLCRRALLLAQLKPNLPFHLRPTLIVNDPKLSINDCGFWDVCNYPGMLVCGPKGTLSQLACPRVVFSEPGDPPDLWGDNAIPIMLPSKKLLPLSPQVLTETAARFQPKLELYRLRKLAGEIPDPAPQQLPGSDLTRALPAGRRPRSSTELDATAGMARAASSRAAVTQPAGHYRRGPLGACA